MNLLLDTHTFLWWITDSPKLSVLARTLISDRASSIFWSAASSWEVGIKYALGRLPLPQKPADYLPRHLQLNGIRPLSIRDSHAYQSAALPKHHNDPFDRMLVAQAQIEDLVLVSADSCLQSYDVTIRW